MNELDPNKYQWFIIPGFRSYDINLYTGQVRSSKHYGKDPNHIMKVYSGNRVQLTDDYGTRGYVKVDELFANTFNRGHKLEPRADSWVSMNNMSRINRNYDLKLNFDQYLPHPHPPKVERLLKPFDILKE